MNGSILTGFGQDSLQLASFFTKVMLAAFLENFVPLIENLRFDISFHGDLWNLPDGVKSKDKEGIHVIGKMSRVLSKVHYPDIDFEPFKIR